MYTKQKHRCPEALRLGLKLILQYVCVHAHYACIVSISGNGRHVARPHSPNMWVANIANAWLPCSILLWDTLRGPL